MTWSDCLQTIPFFISLWLFILCMYLRQPIFLLSVYWHLRVEVLRVGGRCFCRFRNAFSRNVDRSLTATVWIYFESTNTFKANKNWRVRDHFDCSSLVRDKLLAAVYWRKSPKKLRPMLYLYNFVLFTRFAVYGFDFQLIQSWRNCPMLIRKPNQVLENLRFADTGLL